MRISVAIVALTLTSLTSTSALAQLELPAPSPAAKVSQRVGLTDVSVDYSSPGVKGRPVWGDLVPWDKPWRTGANAPTKITFSRDVTVGGKPVAAGTYAVITLPTKKGWTFVLSKATDVSSDKYDAKDDAVRVTAATTAIPHRERMAFVFNDTTDDTTSLDLEWEKLRVSVKIGADTQAQALKNIETALGSAWRPHMSAARYYMDTVKDTATAMKHVDASIAIQSTWWNNWIKADLLSRMGKKKEAREFAQISWDLGSKAGEGFFLKDQVKKALDDWK